jgi:hypothetical protein
MPVCSASKSSGERCPKASSQRAASLLAESCSLSARAALRCVPRDQQSEAMTCAALLRLVVDETEEGQVAAGQSLDLRQAMLDELASDILLGCLGQIEHGQSAFGLMFQQRCRALPRCLVRRCAR